MKTILIYIFTTIITFSVYGQSKFMIYKVVSGPWNSYDQEYELNENYVNMSMEMHSNIVRINDRVNSTYFLTNHEVTKDNYEIRMDSWDCVDEKGRNCKMLLGKSRVGPEKTISVVYKDYAFNYYFYY